MQALKLSAREGWGWFGAGFALFRRNPAQLTMVVVGYWLIILFLSSLPVVGQFLATLTIPAFSFGLMNACREIERGRLVLFPVLFSGFQTQPKPLLALGGLYLVASALALLVSSLADGGLFMQTMLGSYQPSEEEMTSGALIAGAQMALIVMVPVIMAWWYAPVLVGWHGMPVGKSLFFSFVACFRNWQPFLAYSLAVAVFGALLPGVLIGALVAAFPGAALFATSLLIVPMMLIFAPTLIASFYITYRDVFRVAPETAGEGDGDGDEAPPADA